LHKGCEETDGNPEWDRDMCASRRHSWTWWLHDTDITSTNTVTYDFRCPGFYGSTVYYSWRDSVVAFDWTLKSRRGKGLDFFSVADIFFRFLSIAFWTARFPPTAEMAP
jgi:hypothetical protein